MSEVAKSETAQGWRSAFCFALIGIHVFRLAQVLPRWLRGDPPSFPGQYEGRLLGGITGVGIMAAVLISQSPSFKTTRGRVAYGVFLGSAMVALGIQVIMDH